MDAHHVLAMVLTVIFVIGVAGCALAIPISALKFFAVLLEKDQDEHPAKDQYVQLD